MGNTKNALICGQNDWQVRGRSCGLTPHRGRTPEVSPRTSIYPASRLAGRTPGVERPRRGKWVVRPPQTARQRSHTSVLLVAVAERLALARLRLTTDPIGTDTKPGHTNTHPTGKAASHTRVPARHTCTALLSNNTLDRTTAHTSHGRDECY